MRILMKVVWIVALAGLIVGCAPVEEATDASAEATAVEPVSLDEATDIDLRVAVDETFIANMIQEQLSGDALAALSEQAGVDLQLEEPVLDLAPSDQLRFTATVMADAYGIQVSLRPTIVMALSVADGDLVVSVSRVGLGNVLFPLDAVEDQLAAVEATLQEQIAGALATLSETAGLSLKSVLVTDDTLYVDLGR